MAMTTDHGLVISGSQYGISVDNLLNIRKNEIDFDI